ncbi:MAG: (Na+)-NQR maturation NqrM [Planctomycetaceae bacterium]|jgi:uncharacterized protein|nr:(Na+)-NQR maturation NqrM [Planctomycetaceae bacterium]
MMVFVVTTGIFLIAVGAMSVGVIISNRRIQGSCGGLANIKDSDGKTMCEVCIDPAPDCSGDPAVEDCPPELLSEGPNSSSVS